MCVGCIAQCREIPRQGTSRPTAIDYQVAVIRVEACEIERRQPPDTVALPKCQIQRLLDGGRHNDPVVCIQPTRDCLRLSRVSDGVIGIDLEIGVEQGKAVRQTDCLTVGQQEPALRAICRFGHQYRSRRHLLSTVQDGLIAEFAQRALVPGAEPPDGAVREIRREVVGAELAEKDRPVSVIACGCIPCILVHNSQRLAHFLLPKGEHVR